MPEFVEFSVDPDEFDPAEAIRRCVEEDVDAVLVPAESLPAAFFDLRTGVAGDLLHRASVYRVRIAFVLPGDISTDENFTAFSREANRGTAYRFFANREAAVQWLKG